MAQCPFEATWSHLWLIVAITSVARLAAILGKSEPEEDLPRQGIVLGCGPQQYDQVSSDPPPASSPPDTASSSRSESSPPNGEELGSTR